MECEKTCKRVAYCMYPCEKYISKKVENDLTSELQSSIIVDVEELQTKPKGE